MDNYGNSGGNSVLSLAIIQSYNTWMAEGVKFCYDNKTKWLQTCQMQSTLHFLKKSTFILYVIDLGNYFRK